MRNFIITGFVTFLIGIGIGVYVGWVQFPVEYRNSHMCQLAIEDQENYTLMVARGYQIEGSNGSDARAAEKAIERLRPLRVDGISECDDGRDYEVDNIPDWVQRVTEAYISEGADLDEIRALVALTAAFDRLTQPMCSYVDNPPTTGVCAE